MSIMGISQFERFFREAASLDVDKDDLKRLSDFIDQKLHDLLLMGVATAKANGRDVILVHDLPITKGLQESIHQFRKMDLALELQPILDQLAKLPPLELAYGEDVETRLPEIVGGLTYAMAKTFKIIDPALKNPQTEHWNRVADIFSLLL
ncbi:hypothetical protein MIN45_P0728 [Methylomarinovum tepidoasis]|uniref:DUF1931 family protein n=1 Tax=Methylomarinovum tepidoasis TaxID=2840183 RepID=A0AAU9D076_9GAMM|nr:DUF1931 family protein [Methylomarinovum sp. IN45]BCX88359.1 hypothetical protein MIN45_P0728 [Methylomarinovum sp. IN45]